MPTDLQTVADPRLILLAWAAGLALVAGAISLTGIVGPGFSWLTAGVSVLIGLAGVLADDAWWARVGLLALVLGLIWARSKRFAGVMFLIGGLGFLAEGVCFGGFYPAVTAALALGGVTGEMMLGHWYLIDPRLPRRALRDLAMVGIAGLVAEAALQLTLGIGLVSGGAIGFWILLVTSIVLMGAVIAALRYPAYSGVMAATGLSYLALLTTLGAVFVGRAIAAGLGPFSLG